MNPEEYELMFQVERRHWWYLGMEKISRSLLNAYYDPGSGLRILDAGCGTGAGMTTYLGEYGRVTGIDISPAAIHFSGLRGAKSLSRASVIHLPFHNGAFDLVTSFDVLYERSVADDAWAIGEFRRVLGSGGRVLLRLPAYNWLRGQHDRRVHTARRYSAPEVARLLQKNGLRVEYLSYANALLFPLALVKRLLERVFPVQGETSDLSLNAGPFGRFFEAILAIEAALIPHARFPFGLSVVAVGRKD